jgi:hypothetical protein
MHRLDELPWWVTRPLVVGGVLLIAVSNALPIRLKATGLWAGVVFATCGFLPLLWHGYRREVMRRRGTSNIEVVDLIVLSLAGIAIFSAIALGAILAQR